MAICLTVATREPCSAVGCTRRAVLVARSEIIESGMGLWSFFRCVEHAGVLEPVVVVGRYPVRDDDAIEAAIAAVRDAPVVDEPLEPAAAAVRRMHAQLDLIEERVGALRSSIDADAARLLADIEAVAHQLGELAG